MTEPVADAEHGGAWFRVSTKDQDEASQEPDVLTAMERDGCVRKATYRIQGASARKGNRKFDAAWAQVLEDFRTGKITVLYVWRLSRLDRKLAATQMIAEVVKLGGRIVFVKQPHLNNLSTMAGRISLTVEQEIAFAESEQKSDRVKAKHNNLRAIGSLVGKACFGYEIKTVGGKKTLVPTEEGRKWIPAVYKMIIDGESPAYVAAKLNLAGVKLSKNEKGVWWEVVIGRLIRRPTYMGVRPNSGDLTFEPLVSPTVWRAANMKLDNRSRNTRSTTKTIQAMLSPLCGNPECNATNVNLESGKLSPMYRVTSVGRNGKGKWTNYHCSGIGPNRKGCGAPIIKESELNEVVTEAMLADKSPMIDEVFEPGDNHADEITKLQELMSLSARAGDYKKVMELSAQAEQLSALPSKAARWVPIYSDKTVSSHFASLDLDGRRAFLAEYQIIAWWDDIDSPDKKPIATIVHRSFLQAPAEPTTV